MVYINWPLLAEAKLLELIDAEKRYFLTSTQVDTDLPTKLALGYVKLSAASHCATSAWRLWKLQVVPLQ